MIAPSALRDGRDNDRRHQHDDKDRCPPKEVPWAYRPAVACPFGTLWWVELRHAVFGVVAVDGRILFAAPIAAGWLMKRVDDLRAFYAGRGDLVSLVEFW